MQYLYHVISSVTSLLRVKGAVKLPINFQTFGKYHSTSGAVVSPFTLFDNTIFVFTEFSNVTLPILNISFLYFPFKHFTYILGVDMHTSSNNCITLVVQL